ncbi:MAG: decarboxylating 6-phosphogluconate dehydrogenase [Thermoleophilia bacterium]|nr:decarboxylating 6-phosphogluconate dehydrogenase [Thermoleophilia bacterium]MDH3724786.1 decarboxylating 6-phosphogluconate dehydrogenase [Thermoleophilia bacterium]
MQLAMVGLGRMGANLVRRAMKAGHECVVYDVNPDSVADLVTEGATGAASLEDLAAKLDTPRTVWVMVPAGLTGRVVTDVAEQLDAGDIIIDGGNSYYRDDIDRAAELQEARIHYVDVGTSGGVFGLERGFCLMIGGETEIVDYLDPIFGALAPGVDAADRSEGRTGEPTPSEHGYLHCGPNGAGHLVKMVHNGIEYGIMAAYAEGLNVLAHAGIGSAVQRHDAETTPLRDPQYYRFDIDIPEVAEVWRRGSVVASWLLDLTAVALHQDPELGGFTGRVSDSGEGRWTVQAAVDVGVPAHVLTAALYERFSSRGEADYGDRLLSAMRSQFGGHDERVSSK